MMAIVSSTTNRRERCIIYEQVLFILHNAMIFWLIYNVYLQRRKLRLKEY